jgi:uncharacterized protein (DUF58 family)
MPKAATRFIQPDVLSRISSLELLARGVVEGFISGLHRSPYKGFSVEFMSYRPYIPGDDPLRLDWKLFAGTDRLYVKEFEDETNTRLNILVDISHSMGYGSGAVSKLEYGFFLAAALAHLIIRQRDAVGMALFDDKIVRQIPAKSSTRHLQTMMKMMEEAELGEKTALGKPLHELADQHRKRGFVVLISDLLDDPEAIIDGLRHFRFGGHEVLVSHIMDPQEVAFEFTDFVEFEDLETGETLLVSADAAREIYLENLEGFNTRLQEACGQLGVDYNRLTTDQPLDHALFNYLASRKRKA